MNDFDAVKLTVCVSHHPGLPSSTAEGCPSFGRLWAQIAASVTKQSQRHLPFPQSARFVTHWISLTVTEQDWGGCSGSLCSPVGVGLPGKEIFSQREHFWAHTGKASSGVPRCPSCHYPQRVAMDPGLDSLRLSFCLLGIVPSLAPGTPCCVCYIWNARTTVLFSNRWMDNGKLVHMRGRVFPKH